MKNNIKEKLKLYLVTDSDILKNRDFYKSIEDAIKGGVTMVQLREKNASGKEFLEKAIKLREITKKYNVAFIINDRVDIALICDADGVHVGQSDIDAKYVRKLIGNYKILGVSARNLEEAKRAKEDSADYIGLGAMYNTSTKLDAKSVDFKTVEEIKENVEIPIVLIGGINLENLKYLKPLKSHGYALVSALLNSDNIYLESKKWISKI
ncbi:MAG: thiamine phosphate synthase [Romboutsia sp.]|uniref:thiamine phosphate synthase n=1 Tax=Romboutsia sp. TaxID=1965302 RepID=UPI003F2FE4A3